MSLGCERPRKPLSRLEDNLNLATLSHDYYNGVKTEERLLSMQLHRKGKWDINLMHDNEILIQV